MTFSAGNGRFFLAPQRILPLIVTLWFQSSLTATCCRYRIFAAMQDTVDRTILHCDLNGFYASVECLHRPELKDVPMAVCDDVEKRHGIILAKNERAKKFGVTTAETVWQAKTKCPGLVLVLPRHDEYDKYSQLVNQIYERFTPLVEPFGIDESWLDVTGTLRIFGDGRKIADTIRAKVKAELGLSVSVGVSYNKIFAKLGSDYKKPDATTVITRDNYKSIVFPLPVSERDLLGLDDIRIGVMALSETVAARLRSEGFKCQTVQVMIKDTNFKSKSRQRKLAVPSHLAAEIGGTAIELISSAWDIKAKLRTITVTGTELVTGDGSGQLSLFADAHDGHRAKTEKLERAMDCIRGRFGKAAIGSGAVLGNDLGIGAGDDGE